MRTAAILGVALSNLKRTPMRSALTVLGIVVGVAAVVCTISIGSGAKARVALALSGPEARTIYLRAVVPRMERHRTYRRPEPRDRLDSRDYYALRERLSSDNVATPQIYLSSVSLGANGRSIEGALEGTDVAGVSFGMRKVVSGTEFDASAVQNALPFALVSQSLERKLFQNVQAIGRVVRINNVPFTIVGIVSDRSINAAMLPNAQDLSVIVPFSSLVRRISRDAEMNIAVQTAGVNQVGAVRRVVSDLMEERRNSRRSEFMTISEKDSIQAYMDGSQAMARLLATVGAISLIVGGIGVMNIMLVNVSERTREIGIRLAIGTRASAIRSQFLFEAVILSLSGGVVGLILGVSASWLLALLNDLPTIVTLPSLVLAFSCSVIVGVVFGYNPARLAAQLDPVEALRGDQCG